MKPKNYKKIYVYEEGEGKTYMKIFMEKAKLICNGDYDSKYSINIL